MRRDAQDRRSPSPRSPGFRPARIPLRAGHVCDPPAIQGRPSTPPPLSGSCSWGRISGKIGLGGPVRSWYIFSGTALVTRVTRERYQETAAVSAFGGGVVRKTLARTLRDDW